MNSAAEQPLAGKVALVTGGGRGIGRAIALGFAGQGADVAVVARTQSQIEAVATEINAIGRQGEPLTADLTAPEQVSELASSFRERFGRLDILVNNAGGSLERNPVVESDPANWLADIKLNLFSAYLVCHNLIPLMIESGGRVINVGSGMGRTPSPGSYSVGKAGLWMFTQSLSEEVWQHGIDVNELIPGPVETFLTRGRMKVGEVPPFAESERVKPPEDVVPLALWLASQAAGGPTGQSFSIARRPL